ncbi:Serine/threonine-protein phosphatase 7 long form-like [Vitis vinifera]|uniref:Serine/threonine-protein phosphatase 7 long form-like n=1 Tax=Vitis vinifera TaxID=29760 RepID=A0A438GS71_VITVI|nr:Serine/threonine-protein phosphatase 7 long form-like [Vitis vinifera]
MLRTETDVKYIGDEAVIVPLDVPSREDEDEEECESQEGDDQSERAEDIQHDGEGVEFIDEENNNVNVVSSFLALHEAMEGEQGRYVSVDGEGCDMSNNPDPEDPIEFSPVQYHSAPSLQFENVENIGNAVSSDWTPWGNTNIGNSGGEFMVGQVFNSKADLQHAAKLYSISAHQEYVVVESTTKLLVLRCKKAKQSQCPWKLRAMVVKGTTSFAINKYNGPHKCVNPCLNRDHQQLDSNLIAAHIQGMIKAQFTLSVAAIQAKLPHFFIALEQANPGCVVISKTFPGIMENTEIFQRVFWTFHPSIEGFKHCRPVLSIDGTHLYGKYKGTLMIAMGCDGNNQLFPLAFALTEDRHPGIMAAMSDVHLGWSEPYAYHRVCMRHLATIPFEKWALSHDGGRRYGIMTTNMSEVFNSVLKGARSLPITALVQLTFFRLNSYFVVRREQGANRLASNEEYTPYVDAKIKANVVKAGSHEIVLYDHIRGQFHVKTNKGTKSSSTRGRTYRINLQEYACTCGKTLIYGFPCSHILAACHFRSVDFRPLVQHYYSTQSYYNSWAPLFHPIFNVYEWPPYDGPIIVPSESMKRASSGRPKSSVCIMKWMLERARLLLHVGYANKVATIVVLVKTVIELIRLYMEYRGHSSDPDPLDTSVLVLQDRHRSHLVDSGQLASVLTCRQHISRFMREWEMDSRLRPYIIRSGFYGVYRIGHITLDWGLITSLVERWRPETHTFHLPVGEMTITLQDVAVILGLRSAISTRWLCHQFSHPPVDLDDATLERYARAFILGLIVLAHLYRELCRASLDGATDIAGCVTLLQLDHGLQDEALLHEGLPADPLGCRWRVPLSWAQNPSRVLTFYRDQLDAQTHDQVLWEPYMGDLVAHLPAISLADQEIWRMSPLICFDIVEWHRPERVLRQFGLQQGIPPSCSIELDLHSVDRRGRHKYDWGAFHAQYITLWGSREERIATAPPMVGVMQFHDPYMEWYRRITRRLITPPLHRDQMRYHSTAAATQLLITGMVEIASRSAGPTSGALGDIHRIAIDILHVIGEEHRIHSLRQSPTSSYPSMSPPVSATTVRMQPIRGRGRGSRRDDGRAGRQPRRSMHPPETMLAPSTSSTPFAPEASTLPPSPLPSPSPRPSPLGHVTTPLSTSLPSPLPSLEETTTPHVTSPSSLISPLLEPTIPDVIAPATITADVILPSPISPLLDATISDITVPEITPPSTTLPSPTRLPIETTMHHTLTHVTQLDVCPPRRRRGPRRRRVLPPSAPSQPIHTETWQIAQIDSTEMSLYHRRPQRKRKTPSCGTH